MAEPVVSYPGAKWRFYPYMVEYFPLDMKTFIEPFLGGGSVTLSVADDPRFTQLERMIAGICTLKCGHSGMELRAILAEL